MTSEPAYIHPDVLHAFELHVDVSWERMETHLWLLARRGNAPVIVRLVDEPRGPAHHPLAPSLVLHGTHATELQPFLQPFVDEAARHGVAPAGGTLALDAQRRHLEDMRRLVFKLHGIDGDRR